ncbi:MAG: cell wall hydrolase [Lachnospiraceae bacterium]|nr:cell wall hydrolase [Lachnospiraceae bacterium]
MLLVNGEKTLIRLMKIWRCLRAAALLLLGTFLVGCITWMISELNFGGHSQVVYAVSSASEDGVGQEIQAGLMGLVNGVADMERYSDVTRVIRVADSEEEVLAGASGVDRRAIRKSTFSQASSTARQLGYLAQQMVLDNQMSSDDYYTLLQIVEAEATGEDTMSKMLVASVVLNRVKDSHFPDTIYDVVWEDAQFQPTSDGRIYSCTVTEETIEAVERVLAGEDYSEGALFFVARDAADTSKLSWFDSSLVWLFTYGGHDFYTYQSSVNG